MQTQSAQLNTNLRRKAFWPRGAEAAVGAAVKCGWSLPKGTLQTGNLLHAEVCIDASVETAVFATYVLVEARETGRFR